MRDPTVDRTRRSQQDLRILVRGMGEGAAAVDVAQRPYARNRGLEARTDDEEAALVGLDSVVTEQIRVGLAPGRHQQV